MTADLVSGRTAGWRPTPRSASTPSSRRAARWPRSATPTTRRRTAGCCPKGESDFASALVDALKAAQADGTYTAASASGASRRAPSPTSPSTVTEAAPRYAADRPGRHRRPAGPAPVEVGRRRRDRRRRGDDAQLVPHQRTLGLPFALQVMNYKPVIDGLGRAPPRHRRRHGHRHRARRAGRRHAAVEQPVLSGVSFVFTWFFPRDPALRAAVIIGSGLGYLYPQLSFGLPFGQHRSPGGSGWGRTGHLHPSPPSRRSR